ncbi:MAG: 2OG-Fe(II) oxygenase [Burkholderiaceae bacterium]|nr:2OG-Fe(II) oxygenase [Burkholderiaceae bacterium]
MEIGYSKYINAPSIGRIGMAFYEAENKPALLQTYFDQSKSNIDDLRNRCLPYASPIDIMRCAIDEIWPAGAMLESLYGKKMYIGLSRIVEPNVNFLAHHDIFQKDAPDSFSAKSLLAQFAANVYLTLPEKGGDIQIWKHEMSADEFDQMRGDSYGIDPKILGNPDFELRPERGDLILFNSRKMHAVTPGFDRSRLSVSCFIGYRGMNMPLTYWS